LYRPSAISLLPSTPRKLLKVKKPQKKNPRKKLQKEKKTISVSTMNSNSGTRMKNLKAPKKNPSKKTKIILSDSFV